MSNSELLSALEELSRNQATGMVTAVTDDNHHVRIGLEKGEIMHLAAHRLQGSAAIAAIAASPCHHFKFAPGSTLPTQPDLPASEVILNALRTGAYTEAEADFAATPAPTGIDPGLLRIIEEELTEYVGPIAPILVSEAKRQPSLNAILQKLTKELPTAAAKDAFINRIRGRLKGR